MAVTLVSNIVNVAFASRSGYLAITTWSRICKS